MAAYTGGPTGSGETHITQIMSKGTPTKATKRAVKKAQPKTKTKVNKKK